MLRSRVALAAFLAAAAPFLACSVLTDTDGLSDGPAGGGAGVDAGDERTGPLDAGDAGDASAAGDAADAATSRYATAVLADSPLLYYRFGETNGKDARDEVSGTTTPYPVAGFVFGVKGALASDANTAITVDGSTGLQLTQRSDFSGTAPFSVELWVDVFPNAPLQNDIGFVVDHQDFSGPGTGWNLQVSRSNVNFERRSGTGVNSAAGFPQAAVAGTWHHVVTTYDGTTLRLYYDGVRRGEGLSGLALPESTIPFTIGKQNCTGCTGNSFVGSIDELAIYPKALSEARIAAHLAAAR